MGMGMFRRLHGDWLRRCLPPRLSAVSSPPRLTACRVPFPSPSRKDQPAVAMAKRDRVGLGARILPKQKSLIRVSQTPAIRAKRPLPKSLICDIQKISQTSAGIKRRRSPLSCRALRRLGESHLHKPFYTPLGRGKARKSSSGRGEMSLGRGKSSSGRREMSLGRRKSSTGRGECATGRRELSLGRRELSLGRRELSLGRGECATGRDESSFARRK
jgi:hypothetical protein